MATSAWHAEGESGPAWASCSWVWAEAKGPKVSPMRWRRWSRWQQSFDDRWSSRIKSWLSVWGHHPARSWLACRNSTWEFHEFRTSSWGQILPAKLGRYCVLSQWQVIFTGLRSICANAFCSQRTRFKASIVFFCNLVWRLMYLCCQDL